MDFSWLRASARLEGLAGETRYEVNIRFWPRALGINLDFLTSLAMMVHAPGNYTGGRRPYLSARWYPSAAIDEWTLTVDSGVEPKLRNARVL